MHIHKYKPFLTLAPIVIDNSNINAIFAFCSKDITKAGNAAFSAEQQKFSYPHVQQLNDDFAGGEVWQTGRAEDKTDMVISFIDRDRKIQIITLDNNPELPESVRGRNLLLLTSGEYDKKPSFALLTKNPTLIKLFKQVLPNKHMVDSNVFAETVFFPYSKMESYVSHVLDGHVIGKTCASCSRPGHQHDVLTPQGFGFGSGQ